MTKTGDDSIPSEPHTQPQQDSNTNGGTGRSPEKNPQILVQPTVIGDDHGKQALTTLIDTFFTFLNSHR